MPDLPKPDADRRLSVDARLALDKFEPDDEPFIVVATYICRTCDTKPCLYVCPSQVYRLDKVGLVCNADGCFEVGACGVVCKHILSGEIPRGYTTGGPGDEDDIG